ncbi:hypothetical protein [Pseudomonas sp. KCJK8993]|uniref:hypothetical protein n=1 Tax=Pseudomonas sp. KCJK8993 TaxID=3344565 RepID=UPI0039059064
MSANKTIKALREERDQLYAEIRRLQAVAGEQPSIREMARDARVSLRVEPSAPVERDERAEFEQALRSIAGIPGDSINYHATHMSRIARAALERKQSAPVDTVTWEDAEKVAADPEVHDALQMFSEDPTGDAGTSVVRAVLEALERKP